MTDTQFDKFMKALDAIRCCIIDVEEVLLKNHYIPAAKGDVPEGLEPDCMKCRCDGHCSVSLKSERCYHMFRFNRHQ